jgi:hypothetical protein
MRSFYILARDPTRGDLQSVVSIDLAGFNHLLLLRGEPIEGFPPKMCFLVSNKKPTDSLGNGLGWHILPDRALAIVKELVPDYDLQVLDLPLFDLNTKTPVEGYQLANCLRVIPALAFQPDKKPIYAHRVVIKDSLVPPDTHLFLLGEAPLYWIVSEQLWERLSELEGVSSITIQTVE